MADKEYQRYDAALAIVHVLDRLEVLRVARLPLPGDPDDVETLSFYEMASLLREGGHGMENVIYWCRTTIAAHSNLDMHTPLGELYTLWEAQHR